MQQKIMRVPAVVSELATLRTFMQTFWEDHSLPEALLFPFDLALEEVFANIVMHGAPAEDDSVEVTFELQADRVRLRIADAGPPFDPLTEAPAPDLEAAIEERTVGGLGVFLVKELMDEVAYEYRDGRNVLTMAKRVGE
jgi:anti-sigma regulatory factor (Ser/Thr protein kinase)